MDIVYSFLWLPLYDTPHQEQGRVMEIRVTYSNKKDESIVVINLPKTTEFENKNAVMSKLIVIHPKKLQKPWGYLTRHCLEHGITVRDKLGFSFLLSISYTKIVYW
ncbi:auxin response factor 15 [Striga asiatica]|uniref:Auxin response factor 15 n=1 Tax=Striga asiatica TaxID=4170 RepID=A0A5A7P8E5_STRAF|nr:auxin response factor 15 [Striga asiatica]